MARLRAVVPYPPSDLLFVDHEPRWGAEIYLGCDVESIELVKLLDAESGPAYRPLTETLHRELSDLAPDAVFLVPPPSLVPWRAAATAAGWRPRPLGTVDGIEVYGLER